MRRSKVLLFSIALFTFFAGIACGDDPATPDPVAEESTDPGGSPTPEGSETPEPEETDEPIGNTRYEAWFLVDDKLQLIYTEGPTIQDVARAALDQLLNGPSVAESGPDISTAIPEGTELIDLSLSNGILTVDLSTEFDDGGGSAGMFARLGQVVFTATQFDTVKGVNFRIEGEPVETFSSEGIVLDGPQKRKDYEEYVASIVVEGPEAGESVSSPVSIRGTANTFEATVEMRVTDEDGKELKHTFTTATCGTGCRGTYAVDLEFDVTEEQPGFIEVFESSAKDGSEINKVTIPVTLVP